MFPIVLAILAVLLTLLAISVGLFEDEIKDVMEGGVSDTNGNGNGNGSTDSEKGEEIVEEFVEGLIQAVTDDLEALWNEVFPGEEDVEPVEVEEEYGATPVDEYGNPIEDEYGETLVDEYGNPI